MRGCPPQPRRFIATATVLLLLACATGQSGGPDPLELDRWLEVRTPLFTIQTNASEADAVRAARELTAFTALTEQTMRIGRVQPQLPIRIYIFRTHDQFARFPVKDAAGYMIPTLRLTAVGLSLEQPEHTTAILYHEYVHFLLRNGGYLSYPAWYEEGIAELLSSVVIRQDVAWLGSVPLHRAGMLKEGEPFALPGLLSLRHTSELSQTDGLRFYTDSWLLVHYLHTSGALGGPERLGAGLRFLSLLNEGRDWRSAFSTSFDIELEQLEAELAAHRTRLRATGAPVITIALPEIDFAVEVHALKRSESAYLLAELAILVGERERAQRLLRESLIEQPGQPRALALLAATDAAADRFGSAGEQLAQALSLAPEDDFVHEVHGDVQMLRAKSAWSEQTDHALALVGEARQAFQRAADLAPQIPSSWASLGVTFLHGRNRPETRTGIEALMRAYRLAPWHPWISLNLGRLYMRAGDRESARTRLEFVASLSHSGALAREALQLLQQLDASRAQQ